MFALSYLWSDLNHPPPQKIVLLSLAICVKRLHELASDSSKLVILTFRLVSLFEAEEKPYPNTDLNYEFLILCFKYTSGYFVE